MKAAARAGADRDRRRAPAASVDSSTSPASAVAPPACTAGFFRAELAVAVLTLFAGRPGGISNCYDGYLPCTHVDELQTAVEGRTGFELKL